MVSVGGLACVRLKNVCNDPFIVIAHVAGLAVGHLDSSKALTGLGRYQAQPSESDTASALLSVIVSLSAASLLIFEV